ncbi:MAG: hypothetical protein NZ811_01930 [Gammaproteobacteria bacterium]|nr:hypothetical protein [Gammaproteobacteria bacterium]
MAEEVKIIIDVEGGKGAQTVKEVSKDLEKAAKSGDKMSESIKKSGGVTLDVRQKLRDLQNQMAEIGDVGSAEFQQLAAEAGKYKDQMNNANAAIKAMSADFPKLQVGVQALQAMGAAAQTAMSVQALLGTENEEVTKTIQKMIAVQGVMNGLQSVANLLSDESAIGLKIRTIRTNLFTRATVAQAVATGEATVAQKIMNAVMNANPIGLIITGITALIALFVVLGNSVQSIGKFFSDLGRDIMILFGPILEFFGILDEGATNALKNEKALEEQRKADAKAISARNTKRLAEIEAERKALEKAHKDAEEDLNFQIEINNLLGKSSRALTEEKLQNNIDFAREQERLIAEQIASWTKYYEDLFVFSGKSREDFKAQMRGQGIDLDILLQEATDLQEKANQRVQLSDAKLINFRLKGSKKVADAEVKNDKESKDKQKDELAKFLAAKEKAENDFLDSQLSKQDQEENKVRDKYFSLIEQAIQFGEDTAILEEAQLTQIQEIRDRFAEEAKEKQAQEDQERKEKREEQVQSAIDSAENLVKIAESVNTIFHGKELKRIEEKQKRGEQLTKSEIRRLQKEEKIQKAFALAQVAIDTARGISAAVAAGAGLVFPANLAAIISGVSAVLAGVAQASQILGSGSTIDTGGGSDAATIEDAAGGATEAAPLSTVQEGSTLLNEQPQQVVVVEAITEGIKSVGVIEAQATFG